MDHRGIVKFRQIRGSGYIYSKMDYMKVSDKFSRSEEWANAISHLSGSLLAVVGLVLMVSQASARGSALHIIATSVFGSSMVILYFSSTMTHILPGGRIKDLFFNFDRIAIYFLIAGTYTPLVLIVLNGPLGWAIFGVEWGLALTGTILIISRPGDYDTGVNTFGVISYAIMGWFFLIAIVPVIRLMPHMGWIWILIGGFCYTLGIIFFKLVKFPYHHLVWHLLVIAGSISHFFAVFFYVIP
jgi:hemolysin III